MVTTQSAKTHAFQSASGSLEDRMASAMAKIALASRHMLQQYAGRYHLSAIQAQTLVLLAQRGPMSMGDVANALGVTAPTVSDSVAALERRQCVRRSSSPSDRRAIQVALTPKGKRLGDRLAIWPDFLARIVETLSRSEKEVLFMVLIKTIHAFLEMGVIQEARMCVTCIHFRRNVHPNSQKPHHCALADVPIGFRDFRVDCPEHESCQRGEVPTIKMGQPLDFIQQNQKRKEVVSQWNERFFTTQDVPYVWRQSKP